MTHSSRLPQFGAAKLPRPARAAAAALCLAGSFAPGTAPLAQVPAVDADARPRFGVASVKKCEANSGQITIVGGGTVGPGAMALDCQSVAAYIVTAYVLFGDGAGSRPGVALATPIEGGPDWIRSERYAIGAKADGALSQELMKGPMLQTLLEDRFKLKIRRLSREVPVYDLVVAQSGHKLTPAPEDRCLELVLPRQPAPSGQHYCQRLVRPNGGNVLIEAEGVTLEQFAGTILGGLPIGIGRVIVDKTGLRGRFDIRLECAAPSRNPARLPPGVTLPERPEPTAPEIFTALEEQLGLKLEPARGQGTYFVVDSIERPTEN